MAMQNNQMVLPNVAIGVLPKNLLGILSLTRGFMLIMLIVVSLGFGLVSVFLDTGHLVGGIPTPLKNMKVNRDDGIPN